MEEKDKPVNRDLDKRDDLRRADIKEKWSPKDNNHNGEIETRLRNALYAASNASLPNPGEVVESEAHDGDAQDNMQVDQNP